MMRTCVRSDWRWRAGKVDQGLRGVPSPPWLRIESRWFREHDVTTDNACALRFSTRRTIQVRTREDTADEPNENFTVTLSSPSGATLRDEGAVGTIIDDDAPDPAGPAFTVSDARAREGEILRFQVILTPPGRETVTVDYQTASGTAVEGLDYIAAGSRLTFEPGIAQQTVEVRIRKDDIDESNETLTLRLSNAFWVMLPNTCMTS